jgi:hypothetical protein
MKKVNDNQTEGEPHVEWRDDNEKKRHRDIFGTDIIDTGLGTFNSYCV